MPTTKGPWFRSGTTVYALMEKNGNYVNRFRANVGGGGTDSAHGPELRANAALMAAAPEMHAALTEALAYLEARNLGEPAKRLAIQIRSAMPAMFEEEM